MQSVTRVPLISLPTASISLQRSSYPGSIPPEVISTTPLRFDSGSAGAGHGITLDNETGIYFTAAINVPADLYVAKITSGDEIPNVTVSITSSITEVPVNSYFYFDAGITNNEGESLKVKAWTAVKKVPDGPEVQSLLGPIARTLNAGETRLYTDIPQWVGNIPAGTYRYYVKAGEDISGPVWDEDYLDIEVINN
jgi:hypothetical protein